MKKRIISITLVITLVFTFIVIRPLVIKDNVVKAEEYRNGFSLTPVSEDSTGIDTKSSFIFKSKNSISIETVENELKISPYVDFTVIQNKEGFEITPVNELEKNKLYTFSIEGTTWTFQTMSVFKLLGTLPANQTSNVPVNTGIEMYFSHSGADVKEFFNIEPKVDGSFETHGNTIVFVPTELKEKTIYTVTLKSGLKLNNSDQTLIGDTVFSFETAAKDDSDYKQPNGYFNFNNIMNEFNLDEIPKIPMNYYIYNSDINEPINATLYTYNNVDDFMDALKSYNDLPYWSNYAMEDNYIKMEGLSKAITFEQKLDEKTKNQQFLNIPQKMPAGFYLVDCTWDDLHFQTFIQVTDLSFYYINAENENMLWINDISSGSAVNSATVTDKTTQKTYISKDDGIVLMDINDSNNTLNLYKIQAGSKFAVAMNIEYYNYWQNSNNSLYWKYLQTDRNLYKPDDTVSVWGFLKNRYQDEKIDDVTLEITSGGWYYYSFLPDFNNSIAYDSQTLTVNNGFYNGTIELPNLEPRSYQINIKVGDEIISSSYIQVEKYVKPEYKIDVTSNKNAIFIDEPITFTAKTQFYEGTPVSNLDLNYNFSGLDYKTDSSKTDINGESKITYTPTYVNGYQGLNYLYFNSYATLPESGQIYAGENIQVFVNDINVSVSATLEDAKGTLLAEVNKINLEPLNDNILNNDDEYIGEPIPNQVFTGTIYKNEWKKREVGNYYDFINKVVVPRYDYYTQTTEYKNVTLETDESGKAQLIVDLPDLENCYYSVTLNTSDGNKRPMSFEKYFGNNWYLTPGSNADRYQLKSDKDSYSVGDDINVQFLNNDTLLDKGNYLYVNSQNGIVDYKVSNSSEYQTKFDGKFVPNVEIMGIYFNGKTYIQAETINPRLDIENNRIQLDVFTNKTAYKPGDIVTVNLKARIYSKEKDSYIDANGVEINACVVDEALFKLSEQSIDTLESLYVWVPNGIKSTYASHRNDGYNKVAYLRGGMGMELDSRVKNVVMEDVAMEKADTNTSSQNQTKIRSEFKDTAYYTSLQLDDNGLGSFDFKLPDNVTSWRITLAGISTELMAGSTINNVIVTLPYFINSTLNSTYLEGDKPYIGVTSYGNNLHEGEKISYEITCEETGYQYKAEGLAFERINMPLFDLEEGDYTINIKSTSGSGLSDALQKTIHVVKTYHQYEVADYYQLSKNFKFTTNNEGMTKLIFVDQGKGKFIPELYSLAYSGGKRIEQKYISSFAKNLLINDFGVSFTDVVLVDATDYQQDDGGLSILPYSSSDLETTVKLLPLVKDDINVEKVKMYLYNAYYDDENNNKAMALYGLAELDEPVLVELKEISSIINLTMKDNLYLVLAYARLGEKYVAQNLFDKNVASSVKAYKQIARMEYGDNNDSYLEYSALTMLTASALNLDIKNQLFSYVSSEYSKEILVNAEKLTYINEEIKNISIENLSITYTYDEKTYTRDIKNGWPETITLPSAKLDSFLITEVKGEAALVAVYKDTLNSTVYNDDNLSVERNYYNYYTNQKTNEFKQSEIVKVQIAWKVSDKAIDNSYILTDYVPSGLVPIENTWEMGLDTNNEYSCYRDIDGQKVSFYVSSYYTSKPLYYYARVITPGSYKAEGVILQGARVKDSMLVGDTDEIIIEP